MDANKDYYCIPGDIKIRHRSTYPSVKQKRKLLSLMAQHPQLISYRVSQDFSRTDLETLWNNIAAECNSLPGARKTWRQWRKTWQDIKSKVKRKQQIRSGEIPTSITKFTTGEKNILGLKNASSTTSYQENVEFVAAEDENTEHDHLVTNGFNDAASFTEPESPQEVKDEELTETQQSNIKSSKNSQSHSETCAFNCDKLAIQEQRKIEIKEDYLNFKKDYLRQKLLLMKEQTEALKGIAKELSK